MCERDAVARNRRSTAALRSDFASSWQYSGLYVWAMEAILASVSSRVSFERKPPGERLEITIVVQEDCTVLDACGGNQAVHCAKEYGFTLPEWGNPWV